MPLHIAKLLLPPDTIIGVSVGNVDHVSAAIAGGADYVGIGAIYPTDSKSDAKFLGVRGVGPILAKLEGTGIGSVLIGASP